MDLVTGAVGSIIEKLGTLLQAAYELHKGLPEEIEAPKKEIESANTALREVREVPREQLHPQVRLWARDVREASYDMEDILDAFHVHAADAVAPAPDPADENKLDGLCRRLQEKMTKLFNEIKARHAIAREIHEMKKRLQEAKDRYERYSVPVSEPAPAATLDPRLLDMYRDGAQLIGIDRAKADLKAMILSSSSAGRGEASAAASGSRRSDKMKIVSVVGGAGLGKTTLAKAVYDELKPQHDRAAFVSIGQKPALAQVFHDILLQLFPHMHDDVRNESNPQRLIDKLKYFLEYVRHLIVIDDVWDGKSWEIIKLAFPQGSRGSRVIITSRNRQVASEEVYDLNPLSCDDSKKLFYMRLFGGEDKCPLNHPEEASRKILRKCGGVVPLAIITMASLLVGKSREYWFDVCNDPAGFGRGKGNKQVEDTMEILSLSYYDLPSDLKTCFLYLSVYPEDYVIEKKSLIRKWIAEEFIENKTGATLFQRGEEYFNQLINRSMIQAVLSEEDRSIYGCRVHDMMLDLARDISDEQNLVTTVLSNADDDTSTSQGSKRRRLAHQNISMKQTTHQDNHMDKPRVRSLVACGCTISSWVLHGNFQLLRVLALERCTLSSSKEGWHGLDEHLGKLRHLRYIGLADTWIQKLPEDIGALKFLQTLDLKGTCVQELPWSVCLLTQLVCLRGGRFTRVPDGFLTKVTSLEELHIYPEAMTDESSRRQFVKDLGNLSQVMVLNVDCVVRGLGQSIQSDLVQSLGKLDKLQHLTVGDFGVAVTRDNVATGEWDMADLPRHLQHLVVQGIWFPRLPSCINPAHLPNLSHLHLRVNDMDDAALEALGGLPELVYLSLSTYWPRAFCKATVANIISTDGDGFFEKVRHIKFGGWMVWFVISQDSTSVSFSIWNGKGDATFAFGTKTDEGCSSRVAPPAATITTMPKLKELEFGVPFRAVSNGSCGNLSLECIPSLQKLRAVIDCEGANVRRGERQMAQAEAELRHLAQFHPNSPVLEIKLSNQTVCRTRLRSYGIDYTEFDALLSSGEQDEGDRGISAGDEGVMGWGAEQ